MGKLLNISQTQLYTSRENISNKQQHDAERNKKKMGRVLIEHSVSDTNVLFAKTLKMLSWHHVRSYVYNP